MKFELTQTMPPLKKEIISYLFNHISCKPIDTWFHYEGEFKYDGVEYDLECDVKMDNQMFTYKNLHISHKVIEIDVNELVRKGELN